MKKVEVQSSSHSQMIDITADLAESIPAGFQNGICHVFVRHTTCAVTINENADPDVKSDILAMLDKLVPWRQNFFRHFEENSAAHVKSSLLGFSAAIPVRNGKLDLGRWQDVYLSEFDGPKRRQLTGQFIRESE